MNYLWLSIIVGLILGMVIGCVEEELTFGLIGTLVGFVLCFSFFNIFIKQLDYNNIQVSLKTVITENTTNEELGNQIEDLLIEESKGQAFDIYTNIKDEKLGEADVKKIKFTMKKGLLNNTLYSNEKREFKIILKDKVDVNKDVEIIGLGE